MKEIIGPHAKAILEALGAGRTMDRHDLAFIEAFAKELLRMVERIRARGATQGEPDGR